MECLRERLAGTGVAAVFVPEAATDLILAGTAPWTCASMLEFQTRVIALQLEREDAAFEDAARLGDALVICDRGVCGSRAYLTGKEYAAALAANSLTERDALDRYDAVFHLESVAIADEAAYTQANNDARFEDAAEAALADKRTLAAWSAHPNLRVIASEKTFEAKARNLADAIMGIWHSAGE